MKGLAIVIMGVTGSGKTSNASPYLKANLPSAVQHLMMWKQKTTKLEKNTSTVGTLLAKALHCNFIDADDFHSVENKEKMHNGIPLTDEDRIPWLEAVRDAIIDHLIEGKIVIVACSALQPMYRELLRTADPDHAFTFYDKVTSEEMKPSSFSSNFEGQEYTKSLFSRKVIFVCLQASAELIASRLEARAKEGEHFMPPILLQSQIDLLHIDEAESVVFEDATLSPEITVNNIQRKLLDLQLIS